MFNNNNNNTNGDGDDTLILYGRNCWIGSVRLIIAQERR